MVEFVEADETELTPFESYYLSEIVPRVEECNKFKEKYRSKFWGYFWTILFLMCVNLLFRLFGVLLYNHPIAYEQLVLVNLAAIAFIFYPIYKYYKVVKDDIFDTFLAFYGNWQHLRNSEVELVHSPIIPSHEFVTSQHNISAKYPTFSVEIRDTDYQNAVTLKKLHYHRTVSSGVIVLVKFNESFSNPLLLFEKRGFYRKNKFPDLQNVGSRVLAPIGECFHIFSNDENYAGDMLPTTFFDQLLDLKEVFKAKNVYAEMRGNLMRLYFEGARLYFDNHKFWSSKIDKNKFIQMNDEIEQTLMFIETVQVLRDRNDRH